MIILMTKQPSLSEILKTIQARVRNHKFGKYNEAGMPSWSEYVDSVVAKQDEEKSKKLIEEIAKYHRENPDFA